MHGGRVVRQDIHGRLQQFPHTETTVATTVATTAAAGTTTATIATTARFYQNTAFTSSQFLSLAIARSSQCASLSLVELWIYLVFFGSSGILATSWVPEPGTERGKMFSFLLSFYFWSFCLSLFERAILHSGFSEEWNAVNNRRLYTV